MEVILLDKIDNLGDLGEKVTVKPGYGRNYLIPTGLAVPATAEKVREFEERRAELERQAAARLAEAEARKARIEELGSVSIPHRAGSEGKLFGSVGTSDIANACSDAGVELQKSEVRLPDGPLRVAGEYDIALHLHSDIDVSLKVTVVPIED